MRGSGPTVSLFPLDNLQTVIIGNTTIFYFGIMELYATSLFSLLEGSQISFNACFLKIQRKSLYL